MLNPLFFDRVLILVPFPPLNNYEQLYTMLHLMVIRGCLLPNDREAVEAPGFGTLRRLNGTHGFSGDGLCWLVNAP